MWHDLNMVKERWHCDEARMVGDIGYGLREIPKRFVVIRRGNLWGLLYGEDLISDYQWLKVDTDDRLDHKHIMVCGEKGWGLMDTLGRIIIEPVYRRLGPSLEVWHGEPITLLASREAPDSHEEYLGLIDINGKVLAPCVYPYSGIEENRFSYWDGDGVGDSDDYSRRILNAFATADDPDTFETKYGLLNTTENVREGQSWQLFRPQWDECEYMTTAYISEDVKNFAFGSPYAAIRDTLFFLRVRKGDKWGIVDTSGREVTPCMWDAVQDNGCVRLKEKTAYIDLWSGVISDSPVNWEKAWTFRLPPETGTQPWRETMVYYRVPFLA